MFVVYMSGDTAFSMFADVSPRTWKFKAAPKDASKFKTEEAAKNACNRIGRDLDRNGYQGRCWPHVMTLAKAEAIYKEERTEPVSVKILHDRWCDRSSNEHEYGDGTCRLERDLRVLAGEKI